MKAIEMFTIAQFEDMARAAYVDTQQIEKLRETGIPKAELWAINLCEQLASGFMTIAGNWRRPTDQDIYAAAQRIKATEDDLDRQRKFLAAIEKRKAVSDLKRNDSDVDRAAVEALLREGREAMNVPAQLAANVAAQTAPSITGFPIGDVDDEDLPEFFPNLHEGGISFQASEKTRVVFSSSDIDGAPVVVIMQANDTFRMDDAGNWRIIPVAEVNIIGLENGAKIKFGDFGDAMTGEGIPVLTANDAAKPATSNDTPIARETIPGANAEVKPADPAVSEAEKTAETPATT